MFDLSQRSIAVATQERNYLARFVIMVDVGMLLALFYWRKWIAANSTLSVLVGIHPAIIRLCNAVGSPHMCKSGGLEVFFVILSVVVLLI